MDWSARMPAAAGRGSESDTDAQGCRCDTGPGPARAQAIMIVMGLGIIVLFGARGPVSEGLARAGDPLRLCAGGAGPAGEGYRPAYARPGTRRISGSEPLLLSSTRFYLHRAELVLAEPSATAAEATAASAEHAIVMCASLKRERERRGRETAVGEHP